MTINRTGWLARMQRMQRVKRGGVCAPVLAVEQAMKEPGMGQQAVQRHH
jgi:hypothetical protein